MKGKILIIEDDEDINNVIAEKLQKEGYLCRQCFSGSEARELVEREEFDLALMDIMMPGITGRDLLPFIKEKEIPVIILTASDELEDKIALLHAGANDYITKPFLFPELLARIAVQLREAGNRKAREVLTYRKLTLDPRNGQAVLAGKPLNLTRQEGRILEILMASPDKVFTKHDIYMQAWQDNFFRDEKTVAVHISHIRSKIKAVTSQEYIETLWGIGFRMMP